LSEWRTSISRTMFLCFSSCGLRGLGRIKSGPIPVTDSPSAGRSPGGRSWAHPRRPRPVLPASGPLSPWCRGCDPWTPCRKCPLRSSPSCRTSASCFLGGIPLFWLLKKNFADYYFCSLFCCQQCDRGNIDQLYRMALGNILFKYH